jgi:regulator of replication initiation timing
VSTSNGYENEVATLKSQSATLLAENAELTETSNGLKSANSQLGEQVQRLGEKNAELQLAVKALESRTPQQLIDETRSQWDSRPREAPQF